MDALVKLTVPGSVYRFYQQASAHIYQSSAEDIMSDALCAYASLLNKDIAKQLQSSQNKEEE